MHCLTGGAENPWSAGGVVQSLAGVHHHASRILPPHGGLAVLHHHGLLFGEVGLPGWPSIHRLRPQVISAGQAVASGGQRTASVRGVVYVVECRAIRCVRSPVGSMSAE